MSNKFILFLMVSVNITIDAMDVEDKQLVCHLAFLPIEIRDHIASYLIFNDRESDDEFIVRTRSLGTISDEHKQLVEEHENDNVLLAFSRDGSHCVQLKSRECQGGRLEGILHEYYFLIKNIFSDEQKIFLIPGYYDSFISIGFNKQGTKVIAHAKENFLWEDFVPEEEYPVTWYHIVLLTSAEEHEEKSRKTLKRYLEHIGCCKDLAKSLPNPY